MLPFPLGACVARQSAGIAEPNPTTTSANQYAIQATQSLRGVQSRSQRMTTFYRGSRTCGNGVEKSTVQ
jgi:hypothetical protein